MPSSTHTNVALTYFAGDERASYEGLLEVKQEFDSLLDVLLHDPVRMAKVYVRDFAQLMLKLPQGLAPPLYLFFLPGLLLLAARPWSPGASLRDCPLKSAVGANYGCDRLPLARAYFGESQLRSALRWLARMAGIPALLPREALTKESLRVFLILAVVPAMIILPWIIRSHVVFEKFIQENPEWDFQFK